MLAFDLHETFNRESDYKSTGERLKSTLLRIGAGDFQADLYRNFQVLTYFDKLKTFYFKLIIFLNDKSHLKLLYKIKILLLLNI